ncbi:YdeI/OmpD-associated family protein [Chitinophaga rhizosphaerae]|uniref:YdeI/OmpD-associated family protein n=1 Tax=Chitinophaga rhizosphaerae TaxID=1864947 RepID=UPI000F80A191|nr:YdeI/OmpD-associated family protein [Chitinophaga rhizosphaerae]
MDKIDAYIARSAPFARPILQHIREMVHQACPHVEETLKWGMPYFMTHGDNLCHMAAFQQHCALGFWKAAIMHDPKGLLTLMEKAAMGHLGKIASLRDLPPDKTLIAYIREADRLNREGIKLPARPVSEKTELEVPAALAAALKKNKTAEKQFQAFSYSHRKEYIEWINEAKTDPTRDKRIAQAVEWMAEGKGRNWKYAKK